MHTLIFNRCFKWSRKVCSETRCQTISPFSCCALTVVVRSLFPRHELSERSDYLDRGYKMCFAQANLRRNVKNLLAWSALNRWPSSSMAPTSLSFALQSPPTFFGFFFACGRSSLKYRIEWSAIPFSNSGVLLQPPATHLVGILAANSSWATQPLQWND